MRSVNKPHQPGHCFVEKHVVFLNFIIKFLEHSKQNFVHLMVRGISMCRAVSLSKQKESYLRRVRWQICFFFPPRDPVN